MDVVDSVGESCCDREIKVNRFLAKIAKSRKDRKEKLKGTLRV